MKKIIISIIVIAFFAACFIFILFNKTESRTQTKMATFVNITLNGPAWRDFNKIFKKAFSAMDEIIFLMDRFDENSQLSMINKEARKHPVKISEDLYNIIEESINISNNTQGAFDITVAPLVRLWGFYNMGSDTKGSKCLTPNIMTSKIKEELKKIGSGNIVLDKKNKTIFFKKPGTEIDLSAIAKGYAVDKAVKTIKESGIKSALVSAGGEIYCLGKKNIFQGWTVAIQDPYDKGKIIKKLHLKNKAVATSGGYEKFIEYKGRKYSHIIDPRTGMPSLEFCNATVIADDCTTADALATILCVIGSDTKESKCLTLYIKRKYNIEVFVF